MLGLLEIWRIPNFDVINKSSRLRWYFGNRTPSAFLMYCSLLYTAAVSENNKSKSKIVNLHKHATVKIFGKLCHV